jgi:hypothetical protein
MQTHFTRSLAAVLVTAALLLCGSPAFAQTFTHNTTTVSTAQTATDTTLIITSASAATGSSFGSVAVGQQVFVDGEMEVITAVSSTTLTVQRRGNRTAHAAGTPVFIGPCGLVPDV